MPLRALRRPLLLAVATATTIALAVVPITPAAAAARSAPAFTAGAGATGAVTEQSLATGTVSGRLFNRNGTLASVYVDFYTPDTREILASALSASDGHFEVAVPVGDYKIRFAVNGELVQWSGGKRSFETADTMTVVEGQTLTVEEHALAAGSIGGRLTRADGTPVSDSWVRVSDELGNSFTRPTNTDGRYRIDFLPVGGQYVVSFDGPHSTTQYAHDALTVDGAERFAVAEGQTTTVDESLLLTGGMRVVAHDETTGAPIERFCLWVPDSNYNGCTEDGAVVIDGMYPGSWHLMLNTDDGVHLDKDNGLTVVAGGQTTQVDVAMTAGATITTSLTDRATGGPAQGCVQAVDVNVSLPDTGYRQWCTEEGGNTLRIGPLAPGTYQLAADPTLDTLGLQWVGATGGTGSREAAQRITVAGGAVTAGPAIAFDRAGTIRGRYTDLITGAPVGGACVNVITPLRNPVGGDGCGTATAEDGTYTLTGIGPYAWAVGFAKFQYQWRWTGNAVNRHEATTVTVVAGKKVTANLKARHGGGSAAGTIRDTTGAPVLAYLRFVDALTGEPVAFAADVQQDATYTLTNIPPQQVKVYYVAYDGRAGWLGGTDLATADTYRIRNDRTTTITVTIPVA